MPSTREKLLIAVSDPQLREDLRVLFEGTDYEIAHAESSTEAFRLLRAGGCDLLLLSADPSDPIFSSTVSETNPASLAAKTRIILLSQASAAERARAIDLGVDDVLSPPWDSVELLARARASFGGIWERPLNQMLPAIAVSQSNLGFGIVPISFSKIDTLQITNTSTAAPLVIDSVYTKTKWYTVDFSA